jgi:hypothetical protein
LNKPDGLLRFRSFAKGVAIRLTRELLALGMAAALAAQPALAQVDEADRLARCQNNREAFTRLQASLGPIWSDQRLAEARSALREMERLDASIASNSRTQTLIREQVAAGTRSRSEGEVTLALLSGAMGEMLRQKQEIGEAFGVGCSSTNTLGCDFYMVRNLQVAIDQAMTAQNQRAQVLRQMEMHRTNMVALRCDQASAATTIAMAQPEAGVLGGQWRSNYNSIIITISQNGGEVSGRTSDGYSYGGHMNGSESVTLTWTANGGTGYQVGRISYDGNGRAVLIDFGGGMSWQRQ